MEFLIIFIILSLINVVFSTVRSIVTISGSKLVASLINGGYFAFYNIMLIVTVADFPMWQKCVITFVCNVVGVWIVKLIEEKARKDKLWKVEATVPFYETDHLHKELKEELIDHNYIEDVGNWTIFNIYCPTQEQSRIAKQILDKHQAKYFVSESKTLY